VSAGVSIGVYNFKVYFVSTHTETTNDMSYDFVCETILKLAKCKSDIPKLVTEFIKKTAYKVIGYWSHLLAGHIWLNYSRKNSTCKRLKSIKLSRIVFIIYLQKRKDPKILRLTKKSFAGIKTIDFKFVDC